MLSRMAWNPTGSVLHDAERAAEVEIALGPEAASPNRDLQRRRHGPQRHPRTRHQRLQQHVARADLEPGPPGRRMEARLDQRPARVHSTRNRRGVERAARREGDESGARLVPVALLERAPEGPAARSAFMLSVSA